MLNQVIKKGFHLNKDARIIRCRSQHKVAVLENGRNNLRRRRHRCVKHHRLDPLLTQADCQALCSILGVMIDGGIGNDDTCLLRLVGCPVLILVNIVSDVLPPYKAVQRAQVLDVKT